MPLLLSGCVGIRHLKENEKHLVLQRVTVSNPDIDREELKELYAQKPNRSFLGISKILKLPAMYHLVSMYYAGLKRYNKDKFVAKKEKVEKKYDLKIKRTRNQRKLNNLQFRKQKKIDRLNSKIENGNQFMQWGEPIAVYDSTLVQTTLDRFSGYLFAEGYFHNQVTTRINTIGKYVYINYRVDPGIPYVIDSIVYRIKDETLARLVIGTRDQSLLKKGQRYQEQMMTSERERLDLFLKDHGYYDFSRQYVDFQIDTTILGKRRVAVAVVINNPAKRGYHKVFTVDTVKFITDAGVPADGRQRISRKYRDVEYKYYENNYNLKILSQRLFISPEDRYSRTSTFSSQRQLANLDAFKFVNINYDTSGGRFIANVFTSPMDRYEWSNEIGMNVTQGYPVPFYNITFKKRNIFKGLENFELNGRIGFEGVAAATSSGGVYRSTEAGVNASLVFPQFIWPFREATQIRFGKYNPKTRLSVGYSFSDRPEYRRTSTTLSNTYTWQNKNTTQYSLSLTNVSLINSTLTGEFQDRLKVLDSLGNYNLVRSFNPSFVSSMIFGITWNTNYGTFDRNAVFIRAQIESGGTTLNFIDPGFITDRGLQYFKYIRLNLDYRKFHVLNRWATFAYRVNSGIAYSYGANQTLPYEKFYFAGGSNSIRAWRPRRLGPGSVPPLENSNPREDGLFDYQFEKPGEILLEGSVELRGKIIGFVDGAVFLDAGNVWSFRNVAAEEDDGVSQRGNAQLNPSTFFKEIALGTGFGLRFDFTFLILRFDVGIKVHDPARPEGDKFVLDRMKFFAPFAKQDALGNYYDIREPVIYNVGIGFPF